MSETIPTLPAEVAATIAGDVSGQMAVGTGNLQVQVGAMHGGVINVTPVDERPRVTSRPTPVMVLPRRFTGLLDRDDAVRVAGDSVAAGSPVEIHGEPGLGKTVLLRHLAHELRPDGLLDGVVHLAADDRSVPDVLQSLFEAFHETSVPFKPTDTQIRLAFQNRRALLLIDDPKLDDDGIAALLDAAPESVLVVTARERHLWGEGRSIALPGLPPEDALTLVERELGRPLTGEELPAARRLCAELGHHPFRLLRAAARIRDEGVSFAAPAEPPGPASTEQSLDADTLAALSAPEREVVALLAAVPGAALDEQHVAALTRIPDAPEILLGLLRRRVVQAHSPSYSLAPGLDDAVARQTDLLPWRIRALDYFTSRAEALRNRPDELRADLRVCLSLLEWAALAGRWQDVVRLARAIEATLALALRWDAWEQVLRQATAAARALRDQAVEAWAMHQLGTRALCLGEHGARPLLLRALAIRVALGDRVGAAITRHNLRFLPGPPPDGGNGDNGGDGGDGGFRPRGHAPRWLRPVAIAGAGLAIITAAQFATNRPGHHQHLPPANASPTTQLLPPPPSARVQPGVLTFLDQAVGTTSPAQRVTVRNVGRQPLMVISVGRDGPDAGDFTIDEGPCLTELAPGAGCQVAATFTPRATGVRSARVVVALNAPGGPLTVPLTGVAANIPPDAGPIGKAVPDSLTFSDQAVGTTSPAQRVTVRNVGRQPLMVISVGRDGPDAGDFTIDEGPCLTELAPGAGCQVAATFTPRATGVRSARVVVALNAPGGPLTVPLIGVAPKPGPGRLRLEPGSLVFGGHAIGTTSPVQGVTVRNVGGQPVTVAQVGREGPDASDFTADAGGCQAARLEPGATCPVPVTFVPSAPGTRTAFVVIASDAENGRMILPVAGTGTGGKGPGRLVPEPANLTFTPRPVGTASEPKQVALHSVGGAPVTISKVRLAGSHAGDYAIAGDCQGARLDRGQSCQVSVTYTPGGQGARDAELIVSSDAADPETAVPLHGQPSEPKLELIPNPVAFGDVEVGRSSARPVIVHNAGTAAAAVAAAALTGPHAADFVADDAACQVTLGPDERCEFTVTFKPSAKGDRTATLEMPSSAAGGPAQATLMGGGTEPSRKQIEVDPKALSFDTAGQSSSVTVTSVGNQQVTIHKIEVTPNAGSDAGVFTAEGPTCTSGPLQPHDTCKVTVTFKPKAPGSSHGATLEVASDAVGSPAKVPLEGSTPPVVGKRELTVDPLELSFDYAGQQLPVRVTSVGTESVTVGPTTIVPNGGAGAEAFTADDAACLKEPLKPNATCHIQVTFDPGRSVNQAQGAVGSSYRGLLEIPSDAEGTPAKVTLQGSVPPDPGKPALTVDPHTLSFLDQPVGTTSEAQKVTVKNVGRQAVPIAALRITGAGESGADAFTADEACLQAPLEAGATCEIAITFMPGTPSTSYQASLEVVANAEGDRAVALAGTSGPEVRPDLIAASYDVGGYANDRKLTVVVKNQGPGKAPPSTTGVSLPYGSQSDIQTPGLAPETSAEITVPLTQGCRDGCTATVTVDVDGKVNEADEDNNTATFKIPAATSGTAGK